MTRRYVALGSSMAAGPGIWPPVFGAPVLAARSSRNYAHLAAKSLGLDLVDVTYSGATTAHVLTDERHGTPAQIDALDGSEQLVTITIGGNDVGYLPLLFAASLPGAVRSLPILGTWSAELLDGQARDRTLAEVADSLYEVGLALRQRAPRARVLFVDYLTLLPPAGTPAPPLADDHADLGRHVAAQLQRHTAEAAAASGCELVGAGDASRGHHAWSVEPWTVRMGLPPCGVPFHPNAAGMQAVAQLVAARVGSS